MSEPIVLGSPEADALKKIATLKFCPFCGLDRLLFIRRTNGDMFAVCCDDCESHGPKWPTEWQAAQAWNRRFETPDW